MKKIEINISPKEEFTDITDIVQNNIPSDFDGLCIVYSKHTTGCIRILENEKLLMFDMHDFMERIAPSSCQYRHDNIEERSVPPEERLNGFSHLRAMLLNQSESIPVLDGKLDLGKWQRIFFIECDPYPPREDRKFNIFLQGE